MARRARRTAAAGERRRREEERAEAARRRRKRSSRVARDSAQATTELSTEKKCTIITVAHVYDFTFFIRFQQTKRTIIEILPHPIDDAFSESLGDAAGVDGLA